jgi:hypothetical protein
MRTIYIVTSGEYSDYRIDAVFSTKENAEAHIKMFFNEDSWSTPEIEEYIIDQFVNEIRVGKIPISVRMKKNGDVVDVKKDDSFYGVKYNSEKNFDFHKNLLLTVWAKDERYQNR